MSMRFWLGVGAGAVLALALPAAIWIVGLSLERLAVTAEDVRLRDIAIEQARPVTDVLSALVPAELLLGPLGVYIAGRSAGVRGATRWLVLIVATLPLLGGIWLLGTLTMNSALGSPL